MQIVGFIFHIFATLVIHIRTIFTILSLDRLHLCKPETILPVYIDAVESVQRQ